MLQMSSSGYVRQRVKSMCVESMCVESICTTHPRYRRGDSWAAGGVGCSFEFPEKQGIEYLCSV